MFGRARALLMTPGLASVAMQEQRDSLQYQPAGAVQMEDKNPYVYRKESHGDHGAGLINVGPAAAAWPD
jgi:hypothetical protein